MAKVILLSVGVAALVVAFLVGRTSYRHDSDFSKYLDQDMIDNQARNDQLRSCEIEHREQEQTYSLIRQELGALRTCVREYSLLFDTTKFNQKYSIDEVQRVLECL